MKEMEKDEVKETEKDCINNIKIIYEESVRVKEQTITRNNNCDVKLNYIMILNIGFLFFLEFLMPKKREDCMLMLFEVIIFVICIVLNLIINYMVIVGLSMRERSEIDFKQIDLSDYSEKSRFELIEVFYNVNLKCIDTINRNIEQKQKNYKYASKLIYLNIVMYFLSIVIKMIGG